MPDEGSLLIRPEEVRNIARLAHLDLTPEEHAQLTHDLVQILGYVRQLEQLEVDSVPPTAHVQLDRMPLREDLITQSLPRDLALREAPAVAHQGFAVPAFVDEG
jgi:aspartyl-tRNA(Asn)/glutamyl-tRNA(Gln) amidotransferase subunit C